MSRILALALTVLDRLDLIYYAAGDTLRALTSESALPEVDELIMPRAEYIALLNVEEKELGGLTLILPFEDGGIDCMLTDGEDVVMIYPLDALPNNRFLRGRMLARAASRSRRWKKGTRGALRWHNTASRCDFEKAHYCAVLVSRKHSIGRPMPIELFRGSVRMSGTEIHLPVPVGYRTYLKYISNRV